MNKSSIVLILTLICLGVVTLGLIVGISFYVDSATDSSSSSDFSYEKYFNPEDITRVDIIVDEEAFNQMLDTAPDCYIPCSITLNGDLYTNVGIKTKGNSSLEQVKSSEKSERYGFKIKADEFTPQTIAGLDSFTLNSELYDATMMREYLSYDLMKKVGVKTPLFSYAEVYVNGEYWGFYLMVEGINKSFIIRNYGQLDGNLYKPEGTVGIMVNGEFVPDLSGNHHGGHLEYVGEDISLIDEMNNHLVFGVDSSSGNLRILNIARHLALDEDVDDYVNIDEVIAYFAVLTSLSNIDSYYNQIETHNFFIYEKDGKITIFPWDCDLSFAPYFVSPSVSVNYPIDMPVEVISGVASFDRLPLLKKVIENPTYRERYHEKIRTIAEQYLGDAMIQKIDAISSQIRPYMEKDPHVSFPVDEYFDNAVYHLKKFVELRTKSLLGQLEGTIPATYEEQEKHPELLVDPEDLDPDAIGSEKAWEKIWK